MFTNLEGRAGALPTTLFGRFGCRALASASHGGDGRFLLYLQKLDETPKKVSYKDPAATSLTGVLSGMSSMRYRGLERPVLQMSVYLIDTYKHINRIHYDARARIRQQEEASGGAALSGVHNNGSDDGTVPIPRSVCTCDMCSKVAAPAVAEDVPGL